GFVNDHPMVGSMAAKVCQDRGTQRALPVYIMGADAGRDQIDVYSFGAAYLGPSTYPFTVSGDPSAPNFSVKNLGLPEAQRGRMHDRLELLTGFEQSGRATPTEAPGPDAFRRDALRLMTSEEARIAFDLSREPLKLRERYGMHAWGQRALLARRLVE